MFRGVAGDISGEATGSVASPFSFALCGVGLVMIAVGVGHANPPATRRLTPDVIPQVTPGAAAVDSARAEMAIGRFWHASLLLRTVNRELEPREALLLARAEAGYANWAEAARILAGSPWLDDAEGGAGWLLLGRALEAEALPVAAADAYVRYLASPAAGEAGDAHVVRARIIRALAASGRSAAAIDALDTLAVEGPGLAAWMALELADAWADRGDTAAVGSVLRLVDDGQAGGLGWDLRARALLAAGDSTGATEAYLAALEIIEPGARTAAGWTAVGRLREAAGDTAAAVDAFLRAFDGVAGSADSARGARAAARQVALRALDEGRALEAARVLARNGDVAPALRAYDLHFASTPDPAEDVRLARARLLAITPGRQDDAVGEFRALSTSDDPDVGARALESWADLRRRQGRAGDMATLRQWLLERYPSSAEAVDVVFLRGDAAQDRGDFDVALAHYTRLQEMNPALDRSGLARMRTAQIHLGRGDAEAAVAVFEAYLDAFPEGRRWDEASFWVGKTLLGLGRDAEGAAHLRRIREREPLSYYAVRAAEELDDPWTLPPLAEEVPVPLPAWLRQGLAGMDALGEAGLARGYSAAVDRLTGQARATSPEAVVSLARELIGRGLTLEGIRLGLEVRRAGHPWTRTLLETVYPLPYREMLVRAAEERGVDPVLVAAIIRQESAFDADIVSGAGAVGLMQVMPATGRELAGPEGPQGFSRGSLDLPEINLHLGTRFFRDMWNRYDGALPLVLSAYNAGPTRANRWRTFSEASDPLRFTERIPFTETRDYVKQVTRYVALYRALYWAD